MAKDNCDHLTCEKDLVYVDSLLYFSENHVQRYKLKGNNLDYSIQKSSKPWYHYQPTAIEKV